MLEFQDDLEVTAMLSEEGEKVGRCRLTLGFHT